MNRFIALAVWAFAQPLALCGDDVSFSPDSAALSNQLSTIATYALCSGFSAKTLKPKRYCGPRHALIQYSRRLGTILATCWTSRDALTPLSDAYARRCGLRLTTRMQCSTSRYFYHMRAL